MKDVEKPQYQLGGRVVQLGNKEEKDRIFDASSAEAYINNALLKLAKICDLDSFKKSTIPLSEDYYLELDGSPLLPPEQIFSISIIDRKY